MIFLFSDFQLWNWKLSIEIDIDFCFLSKWNMKIMRYLVSVKINNIYWLFFIYFIKLTTESIKYEFFYID